MASVRQRWNGKFSFGNPNGSGGWEWIARPFGNPSRSATSRLLVVNLRKPQTTSHLTGANSVAKSGYDYANKPYAAP